MSATTNIDVSRIKRIMANDKPYRGNDNRFPLASRTHRHKYFLVDELNGETIYRIIYGEIRSHEELTSAEYAELKKQKLPSNEKLSDQSYTISTGEKTERYYKIISKPNELGIVREDNTFEYTGNHFNQGDNIFMSSMLCVDQRTSSPHGGLIMCMRSRGYRLNAEEVDTMIPIFKGLRIYLDTFKPHESCDYKVTSHKVSRKNGKEFLKRYEDFYKISESMMKSMQYEHFLGLAYEIIMEEGDYTHEVYETYYISSSMEKKLIDLAYKNLNDKPIDALIMFATAYDIDRFWDRLRNYASRLKDKQRASYNWTGDLELDKFFLTIKRRLNKEVYKANPSVMKVVEHEQGKYYPPSAWGIQVTVNGNEVEQYR
jgi:hypothetical protein